MDELEQRLLDYLKAHPGKHCTISDLAYDWSVDHERLHQAALQLREERLISLAQLNNTMDAPGKLTFPISELEIWVEA